MTIEVGVRRGAAEDVALSGSSGGAVAWGTPPTPVSVADHVPDGAAFDVASYATFSR